MRFTPEEGYCRVCRFVQPGTGDGRIDWHERSKGDDGIVIRVPCPGAGRKIPKRTPVVSQLNAFVVRRYGYCGFCGQRVMLNRYGMGVATVAAHESPTTHGYCRGNNSLPLKSPPETLRTI